jgi:pyridoxamine 5'-phosphate oxidase
VFLRAFDPRGFVFFTNFASRKARELADQPQAALSFFWQELERQVRIEGCIEKITDAESDAYFQDRPRGSQLGAWASPQSEVIAGRVVLEERFADVEKRFAGQDVPLPPDWGGFRLVPHLIEFWQGRPNRLHDRVRYRPGAGGWTKERLSP